MSREIPFLPCINIALVTRKKQRETGFKRLQALFGGKVNQGKQAQNSQHS